MKKIIGFLLLLVMSIGAFGQLTEVGIFNGGRGEKIPIKLYGVIVQENSNGDLIPRGGNFLTNGMVSTDKAFLSYYLTNTFTEFGGLEQPTNVPCPDGFSPRWFFDSTYNVVGSVFVKNGNHFGNTFGNKADAQAQIRINRETKDVIANAVVIEKPIEISNLYNWRLGLIKDFYGTKYNDYYNQMPGYSSFKFYGQNYSYPAFNSLNHATDELVMFGFPTHSIVNFSKDYVSYIHYKLIDENGNVVCEVNDNKGGNHVQFGAMRGNNHPDDSNRWIKYGQYKLWVKNNSIDIRATQHLTFGTDKTNGSITEYDLGAGKEITLDINVIKLSDIYDKYKFNCNVF